MENPVGFYRTQQALAQNSTACTLGVLCNSKVRGFTDTKGTGRVGWDTIWHGWFRLQERLQGYQLSKSEFAEL
ncbi:MAG: hypothetical protein ABL933_06605 [Methyloglobulus sp.]